MAESIHRDLPPAAAVLHPMSAALSHQMHILARACARLREAERRSDRARRRMERKGMDGPIPSDLADEELQDRRRVLAMAVMCESWSTPQLEWANTEQSRAGSRMFVATLLSAARAVCALCGTKERDLDDQPRYPTKEGARWWHANGELCAAGAIHDLIGGARA